MFVYFISHRKEVGGKHSCMPLITDKDKIESLGGKVEIEKEPGI